MHGVAAVVADVVTRTARSGVVCLAGLSAAGQSIPLDLAKANRRMVLENDAVFGSVNANRSHYKAAAAAIAAADAGWLSRLLTRRVPLADWPEAFERRDGDVKVAIDFEAGA